MPISYRPKSRTSRKKTSGQTKGRSTTQFPKATKTNTPETKIPETKIPLLTTALPYSTIISTTPRVTYRISTPIIWRISDEPLKTSTNPRILLSKTEVSSSESPSMEAPIALTSSTKKSIVSTGAQAQTIPLLPAQKIAGKKIIKTRVTVSRHPVAVIVILMKRMKMNILST
jgi:hypothetical protein